MTVVTRYAAVLLVGGVLAYVAARAIGGRLAQGAAQIDDMLAGLWRHATMDGAVELVAGAVLPDGERVMFDQVVRAGGHVDTNFQFTWRGETYRVTQRRADGWYDAVRVL